LDLLIVVRFILESEEERTGPAGAGDQASDLGEASIADASILVTPGFDINEMDLVLPLADKSRAGRDSSKRLGIRIPGDGLG
jgi:hypothetical protein